MTSVCHSPPAALTINCKRSFSDFDESSYQTPLAFNFWKRHCSSGTHLFSPPATPRGKRCAARRFEFDESILAALALPELAMPDAATAEPTMIPTHHATVQLKPRFSYPSFHDIVLPTPLHATSTAAASQAPSTPPPRVQQEQQLSPRLSPVPEELEPQPVPTAAALPPEADAANPMPPPPPVVVKVAPHGKSHSASDHHEEEHHHHTHAHSWRAKLPEKPSRAGTEYARCA